MISMRRGVDEKRKFEEIEESHRNRSRGFRIETESNHLRGVEDRRRKDGIKRKELTRIAYREKQRRGRRDFSSLRSPSSSFYSLLVYLALLTKNLISKENHCSEKKNIVRILSDYYR